MSRNAVRKRQTEPSFPRKWESRTRGLGNCFYPISFRADRSRFPPARE
ncbi:pilS cassette protein [Neisseria gonorrhoeae]